MYWSSEPITGTSCSAAAAYRNPASRSVSPGRASASFTISIDASATRRIPSPMMRATSRDPLLGEARVEEQPELAGALERLVVVDLRIAIRDGQADGLPLALERLDRQAGLGGDVVCAVLPGAAEHLLHGQHREALLVDRAPQLFDRDPRLVQLLEQVETGRARVAIDPLEEPLGLEVGCGYAPSRSISRRRSSGITDGSVSSRNSSRTRAKRRGLSRCGK